jgi:hypothetical protein
MRVVWRKGVVRLVLLSAIAWAVLVLLALAFHLWSCTSSVGFLSGAFSTSGNASICTSPTPQTL